MSQKKSDKLANLYREEGNQLFLQKKYHESIIFYNKSLCFSETTRTLSLAYKNRGDAFFALNQLEESMQNLEVAKKICDGQENKLKININQRANVDLENFVKLSYPPNPKIPFIVNCVEYRKDKEKKFGLFANQDMNVGDIICIDKSLINFIPHRECYKRCCRCATTNKLNLIPCSKTIFLMFCSEECREKTYNEVSDDKLLHLIDFTNGKMDFRNSHIVKTFLEERTKFPGRFTSIFDYDLSNENDENYNEKLKFYLKTSIIKDKERSLNSKFCCKITKFNYDGDHCNYGIGMTGHLFKHSCLSNVDVIYCDNKLVYYVTDIISEGDELSICYESDFASMPYLKRKEVLNSKYGIVCTCEGCIYKRSSDFLFTEVTFICDIPTSFEFAITAIKNIFENYQEISESCWTKYDQLVDVHSIKPQMLNMMMEISYYITYGHFKTEY